MLDFHQEGSVVYDWEQIPIRYAHGVIVLI